MPETALNYIERGFIMQGNLIKMRLDLFGDETQDVTADDTGTQYMTAAQDTNADDDKQGSAETFTKEQLEAEIKKARAEGEKSGKDLARKLDRKKLGINDDGELDALVEKLNAEREAAAKNESESDKRARAEKRIAELEAEIAAQKAENAAAKLKELIRGYGVSDAKEIAMLAAYLPTLVSEDKTIEDAAKEELGDYAKKKEEAAKEAAEAAKLPKLTEGAGKSPINNIPDLQIRYDDAKKKNDRGAMTRILTEASVKKQTINF